MRGGLEGTLRIGAIPTSLPVSTLVTTPFRERHPRMRIQVMSMNSRQIADGLVRGELDAGLTYLDNDPLPDVETLPLWHEHYLLLTAADGPLAGAVTVAWRCASTLRLCLLTPDMQHRRIVDAAFAAAGVQPDPAVETNSISTLIAHAGTGLPGITAHTWLYGHALAPGLRAIPLVDPVVEHTIGLVTSQRASGRSGHRRADGALHPARARRARAAGARRAGVKRKGGPGGRTLGLALGLMALTGALPMIIIALLTSGGSDPQPPPDAATVRAAQAAAAFPLYWAGESVAGLPLTAVTRDRGQVNVSYGTCTPAGGEGGCTAPVTIQTTSICARNPLILDLRPRSSSRVRGVPARDYGDYLSLEIDRPT